MSTNSNNLTWRDVQYLIVHTSRHEGLTTPREPRPWRTNGAGLWVSHHFGFGAIDAEALVTRARHWTNVPQQKQATYFPDIGHGYCISYIMICRCITFEHGEPLSKDIPQK